jgi:iron complex outermembrane receptor protein
MLAACLFVAFGTVTAVAAHAQAAPAAPASGNVQTYALDPAPLVETLQAISRISGRKINFDAAAIASVRASAVSGKLTPQEAVGQALKGTALSAQLKGDEWHVSYTTTLDTVIIIAKRDEAETSFLARRSDTATRGGVDLMDVPQSVTIITAKVLETQQALSVQDALQNVSGVVPLKQIQALPSYEIRGFGDNTGNALINGVSDRFATSTSVSSVERIEVLKGPQAILAGNSFVGGAVNVVTKKPQAEAVRSLMLQYGSYGDKTIAADFSGAMNEAKTLSYRSIGSITRADRTEVGYDGRRESLLMQQFRWKDRVTDAVVGVSFGRQHEPVPNYTFYLDGAGVVDRPNVRLANRDGGFDVDARRGFYSLEQKLGEHITFVSRMQRTLNKLAESAYTPSQRGPFDAANPSIYFSPLQETSFTRATGGDHYVRLEGDSGPVSHKLSIGFNHNRTSSERPQYYGADGPTVDVTSPVQADFPEPNSPLYITSYSKETQKGLYLQD